MAAGEECSSRVAPVIVTVVQFTVFVLVVLLQLCGSARDFFFRKRPIFVCVEQPNQRIESSGRASSGTLPWLSERLARVNGIGR